MHPEDADPASGGLAALDQGLEHGQNLCNTEMMANYQVPTLPALVAWARLPTGDQCDCAPWLANGGEPALRLGVAPDNPCHTGNATDRPS
jgi:hypothetical protein